MLWTFVESKWNTLPMREVKGNVQLYHLKHSFHSSYSVFWVGLARFSIGKQGSECNRLISCGLCLGRTALQKRVMALLRRIEHPTAGNTEVCIPPRPPPSILKASCYAYVTGKSIWSKSKMCACYYSRILCLWYTPSLRPITDWFLALGLKLLLSGNCLHFRLGKIRTQNGNKLQN